MRGSTSFGQFYIDEYVTTPKYLQLSNSVLNAIAEDKIKKNDLLPSINELSYELSISRDTAKRSYKYLKTIGVLDSVPGKGYYIVNTSCKQKFRIFLLFNNLSIHKKVLYDAIVSEIGEQVDIDLHVYNDDFTLFKKLLKIKGTDYSHYVIIPPFCEGSKNVCEILKTIPKEKLILLNKAIPEMGSEYAAAYENFEMDIYNGLYQVRGLLNKYNTLKLIFSTKNQLPQEIVTGFKRFCHKYQFAHKLVTDISCEQINKGDVYINLIEEDLVTLVQRLTSLRLKVGIQIGIISYNESPLKKFILGGITTISIDFSQMGAMVAQLILEDIPRQVAVPVNLIVRASL